MIKKAETLKAKVKQLFSDTTVSFEFFGASELLGLARRMPPSAYNLALAENPISSSGEVGYIALVKLQDFYKFICDDSAQLRRNLFEANVRDYQGTTAVNDAISDALKDKTGEDFWWLNNGVTVVATKATVSAKTLTLEDPQIVNGLQTSYEIHRHFATVPDQIDSRNLLVRVIVPTQTVSRDRVIKATNSQTTIPQASLRATDKIHRDIEDYLRPHDLFYDRRKNLHKNEGRPQTQIISISSMGQAVMSILLQRPDGARARPSSLLAKDADYKSVFSTETPIHVYLVCATIVKMVSKKLRFDIPDTRIRNNLLFYVAMHVSSTITKTCKPSTTHIASIDLSDLSDNIIQESFEKTKKIYDELGGSDKVAKGSEFVERLKNDLTLAFPNDLFNQKT